MELDIHAMLKNKAKNNLCTYKLRIELKAIIVNV